MSSSAHTVEHLLYFTLLQLILGVIPTHVFMMLVLMALVTTVCTAPLLRLWLRRIGHTMPALRDA